MAKQLGPGGLFTVRPPPFSLPPVFNTDFIRNLPRATLQGIGARLFMIGTLTAGQFMIYDDIKRALGAKGGAEIQKVPK